MNKNKQKYIVVIFFAFFTQFVYALNSIDTQVGPDGMSVHLMKAKVSNGVLTVSILFDNDTEANVVFERPNLNEVHYVADSKKYPVLKDANGDWLASPVHDEDKLFKNNLAQRYSINKGKKDVVWFKFPAPPEGTTSIEISLPGVSPFTAELGK